MTYVMSVGVVDVRDVDVVVDALDVRLRVVSLLGVGDEFELWWFQLGMVLELRLLVFE